jgi:quercetin dioxygenase-like cupin family protein
VLKGAMELQVDEIVRLFKAGEGINVKAGIAHQHKAQGDTWVMVTSKWSHEHIYFAAARTK